MSHKQQRQFIKWIRDRHEKYFLGSRVLDIGSLDINGSNRQFFTNCDYTGIDLGEGAGVDVVALGHEFNSDTPFDVVISTECLEHDQHYPQTLNNAVRLLRPGGMLVMTCASTGRREHGTTRRDPSSAPYSSTQFNDYYCNLTEYDIRCALDCDRLLPGMEFYYNTDSCDLYFVGFKSTFVPFREPALQDWRDVGQYKGRLWMQQNNVYYD